MTRCISAGYEKIAPDWDNHGEAVRFAALEPPWFRGYANGGFSAEFIPQAEKILASDRMTQIKVGLPTLVLTFPVLYGEEIQILRDYAGEVSIYALDQESFVWRKYNAIMLMPDTLPAEGKFEKRDVAITFIDLQVAA